MSIGTAIALAGVLALGCGGNSAPDRDAADGVDEAGEAAAVPGPAPDPASGAEPASPATLPVSELEGSGVGDRPSPSDPPAVDPVQLSSETVRVAAEGGSVDATLFLARSPLGTQLELTETGERICVRGELGTVPGDDYPNYWGGEVGLLLTSSPATDMALPGEGVSTPGFGFRLEGELPAQLRLRVGAAGEVPLFSQYCQNVIDGAGTSIEVALESLTFECWLNGGAPYPEAASATLVSWQLPAGAEVASTFDFCIEDIRALP